jgi:hypothetical protein
MLPKSKNAGNRIAQIMETQALPFAHYKQDCYLVNEGKVQRLSSMNSLSGGSKLSTKKVLFLFLCKAGPSETQD